jgi:hypothetical protein
MQPTTGRCAAMMKDEVKATLWFCLPWFISFSLDL